MADPKTDKDADQDDLAKAIDENRHIAAEHTAPAWQPEQGRAFWKLSLPRFRGVKLGLGIGLLVVGLAAGLSELYNIFWNTNSVGYLDSTTFLSDAVIALYVVLAIGLLGLASIALPLLLVWGKGKKRAIVTFSLEFAVILVALAVALIGVYHLNNRNPDGVDPDPFCAGGACSVNLMNSMRNY